MKIRPVFSLLPLLLLPTLVACGSSPETDPEPPAPVESAEGEQQLPPGSGPGPGPESEPEREPEPEPTFMERGDQAAANGSWAEARRLYGEAATEEGVSPEQFAEAEVKIAMLYVLLAEEPDLDAAQLRLDEARNSSPRTARLQAAALQKLVDVIRERDETVRRLTELIGNERLQ